MLKGIDPVISPELLKILSQMGHGDEILISDAHFPAHIYGKPVIRADGVPASNLLYGIIPLFELDQYVKRPVIMMSAVEGDQLDPEVEIKYCAAIDISPESIERIERFDFYDRVKNISVIVVSGETAKYGNVILKKGVTPCGDES